METTCKEEDMPDRWIVSDYKFRQQKSLEIAEVEMQRLAENYPEKKFRVYRIKTDSRPSHAKFIIASHEAEIEALRAALHGVIGYALTAHSQSPEWLQGMADKINEAA